MTIEILWSVLLFAGAVAWAELWEWLPWLARRIVLGAATALPPDMRQRMREELLGELSAIPGRVAPFGFACSAWLGLWRTELLSRADNFVSSRTIRMLDVLVGGGVLFLVAPVLLLAYCATSASSRNWRLHRELRLGRNGVPFLLFRLETRHPLTQRLTPAGRAVRLMSVDELPTLFNVVRGEMSCVGPLPGRQDEPADASLTHLRPGLVWLWNDSPREAEFYGRATIATLKVYAIQIGRAIAAVLYRK